MLKCYSAIRCNHWDEKHRLRHACGTWDQPGNRRSYLSTHTHPCAYMQSTFGQWLSICGTGTPYRGGFSRIKIIFIMLLKNYLPFFTHSFMSLQGCLRLYDESTISKKVIKYYFLFQLQVCLKPFSFIYFNQNHLLQQIEYRSRLLS